MTNLAADGDAYLSFLIRIKTIYLRKYIAVRKPKEKYLISLNWHTVAG